jgi:hypothetical protein
VAINALHGEEDNWRKWVKDLFLVVYLGGDVSKRQKDHT